MCMHGVECCGENPQDAPSFHSYVSSVPEFRVRHKKEGVSKSTPSFLAQSPDFHKLGLCYYLKILYL